MKPKRTPVALALFLILTLTLAVVQPGQAAGQFPLVDGCRIGIDVAGYSWVRPLIPNESVARYDLPAMGIGSYLDWTDTRNPSVPSYIRFLHVILTDNYDFNKYTTNSTLYNLVQSSPRGDFWVIGNEPDGPNQDGITAEAYADRYFTYFNIIRGIDPSARILFATLTSATKTRMDYMKYAWAELQRMAATKGKNAVDFIDIVSSHGYVLNEGLNQWGSGIPPAISQAVTNQYIADATPIYNWQDLFSSSIFESYMVTLRQWMKDNGLQNNELWVTEYGNLLPPISYSNGQTATYAQTSGFMTSTFDWMLSATSTTTGNPNDGNRLVQKFFWFSMNGPLYYFGGTLVDPFSLTTTPVGTAYQNYDPPAGSGLPSPAPNLQPIAVTIVPWRIDPSNPSKVIYQLTARVRNMVMSNFTAPANMSINGDNLAVNNVAVRVSHCGGDALLMRTVSLTPNQAHTYTVSVLANGQSTPSQKSFTLDPNQFGLPHNVFLPRLTK